MTLIVCVHDYWKNQEFFQIDVNEHKDSNTALKTLLKSSLPKTLRRLRLIVEAPTGFCLIRELKEFPEFAKRILVNPALRDLELLWIEIVPPKKECIDYKWNSMLAYSLWVHIETEHIMSWLSTLGGGFSALGEQFSRCAETAGKISMKQLHIGISLGDPFIQARCKLYLSISLIQTGRLRAAKYLIRQQYEFAKQYKESDRRLMKMCKGIWLRLQYEYGMRLEAKIKQKLAGAGDSKCNRPILGTNF